MRPVVERRLVAELLDRQVGLELAAVPHHEAQRVRRAADHREVEPPAAEHRLRLFALGGIEHHEHALLALRQQHLVGAHAGLAARHGVEVELDAQVTFRPHLHRRGGEAGGAHVLDRHDGAGLHQLEAGFQQQLLCERVADLHGGALFLGVGLKGGGRHGGAVDAVAAGLGAEIDDRVTDAGRLGGEDLVGARDADRHGVDQDVAVVAGVEVGGAADRRHPETVAVAADAGHDAGHEMAGARVVGRAEAQQVEAGDRARAHGEHVAQDAADARRRALVGLDEGGVVVALHLEDAGLAVADVDHAGVLARPLDDPGRRRRQRAQVEARGLVRAVLVPHGREDAEFGEARRAPDEGEDALVLVRLQAVGSHEFGCDGGVGGLHRSLNRSATPPRQDHKRQ